VYKKYSYEEIKNMLKTYLNPADEADVPEVVEAVHEVAEPTEPEAPFDGGTPIADYKPASSAPQPVKSAAAKFDELFEEDED
jgi:hypothetical protein